MEGGEQVDPEAVEHHPMTVLQRLLDRTGEAEGGVVTAAQGRNGQALITLLTDVLAMTVEEADPVMLAKCLSAVELMISDFDRQGVALKECQELADVAAWLRRSVTVNQMARDSKNVIEKYGKLFTDSVRPPKYQIISSM